MGFLKSLFGINSSTREKLFLQDNELGAFTAVNNTGNRIIWHGAVDFLGAHADLFMHGEKDQLDASQKQDIISLLQNETTIEPEINQALKELYDNAGKQFNSWKEHFICNSISSSEHDINLTMEEKDSNYHFAVQIVNGKVEGVSIYR